MASREELKAGQLKSGEMNGRRFAEHIRVAHGTVKRWLSEGMPARRESDGHGTWITPSEAQAWIDARFQGRRTVAFDRHSVVYIARAEDGRVKIGWSSDVMRRIAELRKKQRCGVQLVACVPGDKPDELRLHSQCKHLLIADEWYRDDGTILGKFAGLMSVAAPVAA